jgi:hypothetical protein
LPDLKITSMKKIFTTLLIVLGFATIASAQTKSNVEFGVNVGYNESYVIDSYSGANSSWVNGFNVGVSADYYFNPAWSLKVKAIYDQKGWGDGYLTDDQGNTAYGVNYKLNYLTVPVLANWHFGRTRNVYLDFGPYVGFLLNAKDNIGDTDLKPFFNSTDAGLDVGIGFKFPVSNTAKFFVEFDGQAGVTNIVANSGGSSVQSARSSINVGFTF